MEEMQEGEAPEQDMSNPRLQAIMDLLKFLSQSEAKRTQPAEQPAEQPAMPQAVPHSESAEGEPSPEELEALKSLMG